MNRSQWPAITLCLVTAGTCVEWPFDGQTAPDRATQAPSARAPREQSPALSPAPAPPPPEPEPPPPPPVEKLTAPLEVVVEDAALGGEVQLKRIGAGVAVRVEAHGFPRGKKAVHIHTVPDCSDPTEGSTGPHFAPEGQPHGLPDAANHHRGDLGDLKIDKHGKGTLEIVVKRVSLERDAEASMLGRALVVRSRPEDGLGLELGRPLACAELLDPHVRSHQGPERDRAFTEPARSPPRSDAPTSHLPSGERWSEPRPPTTR